MMAPRKLNSVSSVTKKALAIKGSTNISGNKADRMRDYLDTVYAYAEAGIAGVLTLFWQNYAKYIDCYYTQVDPERGARIDLAELTDLRTRLQPRLHCLPW